MRISLSWLSAYVPVPPPEEVARRLTAVGLEVEAVERIGRALEIWQQTKKFVDANLKG